MNKLELRFYSLKTTLKSECLTACLKHVIPFFFTPQTHLPVVFLLQQILRILKTIIIPDWIYIPFPCLCVSAELCPSSCDCTTWWEFWSASQKGSDFLILLHIYKSTIYLCFLFPAFCSVNFHMLQYFLWACVCVSLCVPELEKSMMSGMMLLFPWK